jgi:tight adherence protein C
VAVTAVVLGWSWALLAAAALVRVRPAPTRRRLRARARPAKNVVSIPTLVGRAVLSRVGRPDPPPLLAGRVGLAVLAGLALLPIRPAAVLPAAAVGWAVPGVRERRMRTVRQAALDASLPEVVDLLVLATGAGLTVRHALAAVAARADGPLAPVLAQTIAEADQGRRLADALEDVPARAGESTRPLVGVLLASERYGAPVGAGLERLAAEVRADTRRRAEAAARRVPVKLLFPLVVCILPAFGLLTVAPLVAGALRSLRLS